MNQIAMDQFVSNPSSSLNADLTCIRGIGTTKRQWLASLGITNIQALATISAETLKAQLKAIGNSVSQAEIEGWIQQAQKLVMLNVSGADLEQTLEADANADSVATAITDVEAIDEWRSLSVFKVDFSGSCSVEFQTRQMDGYTAQRMAIRNLTTTAQRMITQQLAPGMNQALAGLAETELEQWILHRLQANLQLESLVVESPEMGNPVALDILQVQIEQSSYLPLPMIATRANPLFPDSILGDRSFDLAVTIAIPEAAIADLQHQLIILSAACEARHLSSGSVTQWSETQMNVIGGSRSVFTLVMRDLLVSELGAYRLRVLANIQNLAATAACLKVPVLEVETPNPGSCLI